VDNSDIFGVSTAWVLANAWNVVIAVVVLAVGWIMADLISRQMTNLIRARLKNDATIAPLVGEITRYGILCVTIVIVLGQFGVQTASILAVLGAAGLAVALALQGTLSNIAAGIMLLFLKPFKVGDYINADGIEGWVVEVELFATRMRTADGVFMFAPNSKLSNARIVNYTREASRMVEIAFSVPRMADLTKVRSELTEALKSPYSEAGVAGEVLVDSMDDSKINLVARMPVRSGDWRQARSLLQEQLMAALDRNSGFSTKV